MARGRTRGSPRADDGRVVGSFQRPPACRTASIWRLRRSGNLAVSNRKMRLTAKLASRERAAARAAARKPVPWVCDYSVGDQVGTEDGGWFEVIEVIPADRDGGDHHVVIRSVGEGPAMRRLVRERGVLIDGGQDRWARRLPREDACAG